VGARFEAKMFPGRLFVGDFAGHKKLLRRWLRTGDRATGLNRLNVGEQLECLPNCGLTLLKKRDAPHPPP